MPPAANLYAASRSVIPASRYTFDQLATIYNQARVDYIVPMPMNSKRMGEYVRYYDINLDASFVSLNDEHLETGVIMLGVRGNRSWITRLGVIPERRGKGIGQYLTEAVIEESIQRSIRRVQLEVIVGNEPAHALFLKLGFVPIRELMVIRRPPGMPAPYAEFAKIKVYPISDDQFEPLLNQRSVTPSWIEETASLLNVGGLRGVYVETASGDSGWVIFQRSPFQLTHFALSPNITPEVLRAALHQIHQEHAMQDTKIENMPVDHDCREVFHAMGYLEVFRRTEMYLYLD
jgi:ribosomal protein S18 acetylase RimI-like enzyme